MSITRVLTAFGIAGLVLVWQFGYMDQMIDGALGLAPDAIEEKASLIAQDTNAVPAWLQRYVQNNPFLPGYDADNDPRFAVDLSSGKVKKWPVLQVIDGDSLVVLKKNRKVTVNLAGIDAFELGQPGGEEALKELERCTGHMDRGEAWGKDYLLRKGYLKQAFELGAKGGWIYLNETGQDKDGSLIAYVYGFTRGSEGFPATKWSCNYKQVEQGHAYNFTDAPVFVKAAEGQGASLIKHLNRIPPWEWRVIVAQDDLP